MLNPDLTYGTSIGAGHLSMDKKYKYLIVVLLIIVSLIAFGRILSNGFINLDDNEYITEKQFIF